MDDNTLKRINEALNTDMLAKVNGGGGIDPLSPNWDYEKVKEYVLIVAQVYGPEVAIDVAVGLGIPRSEAESWFAAPTE